MKPTLLALFLVTLSPVAIAAEAQVQSSALTANDIAAILGLQILKFEIRLPRLLRADAGYSMEYWTEDWTAPFRQPIRGDQESFPVGYNTSLLFRLPDEGAKSYTILYGGNSLQGASKIKFTHHDPVVWLTRQEAPITLGSETIIAIRAEGQTASHDTLEESFTALRKGSTKRMIVFKILIKEVTR